ncbi:hypothetical protein ACM257_20100 [Alteromonas macleodii]|uniref:hypothetical protein n=1 Tax=Alteromonas macleodii TaxID=28108 RepID=UPI0039F65228
MSTKNKAVKGHHHMWRQPPLTVRVVRAALLTISLFVVVMPFAIAAYALVTL